jgi:thiamine-phosphate pyrophosphorylase
LSTNRKHSRLHGLYAITDSQLLPGEKLFQAVESALLGGARILQYRDKSSDNKQRRLAAERLQVLCRQHDCIFIINDDVNLAAEVGANGVHLGLTDDSIAYARETLGEDAIIGATCHGSLENALQATSAGADYLAFGRFFSSHTKPHAPAAELNVLQQAKHHSGLPVVAIGGITFDNAHIAINQGADMIAVVHSLFAAADIEMAAAGFQKLFTKPDQ